MIRRTSIEALNDAIAVTQSIAESLVITAGYACQSGALHALTDAGREWLTEWRAMMGVGS